MTREKYSQPPALPSDRELREWLWKNHGHVALYGDDGEMQCPECNPWDYKRAPLLAVVRAAFAAVRARPTLTAEDVRGFIDVNYSADFVADYFNAILAAKHKGGDAYASRLQK